MTSYDLSPIRLNNSLDQHWERERERERSASCCKQFPCCRIWHLLPIESKNQKPVSSLFERVVCKRSREKAGEREWDMEALYVGRVLLRSPCLALQIMLVHFTVMLMQCHVHPFDQIELETMFMHQAASRIRMYRTKKCTQTTSSVKAVNVSACCRRRNWSSKLEKKMACTVLEKKMHTYI